MRIAYVAEREIECQDLLGMESRVDAGQAREAPDEESRPDEEDDRERHLAHDEHAALGICQSTSRFCKHSLRILFSRGPFLTIKVGILAVPNQSEDSGCILKSARKQFCISGHGLYIIRD